MQKPLKNLIADFQAGDVQAFEALVRQFQNMVTAVAYANVGDIQQSEDLAQQAFLTAWQKRGNLKSPERFSSWLYGIVRNLARNKLRHSANRNRSVADLQPEATIQSPDLEMVRKEQAELLWSTLEKIPVKYREPIVLFYREGSSLDAVAVQLGLSKDATKQRLSRGRKMLKAELEHQLEEFLNETQPSSHFCAAVIATIPVASSQVGVTAAKVGTAFGGKWLGGAAGTVGSWSIGTVVTAAGGALSLLVGFGIAWFNTRKAIAQATSKDEQNIYRKDFKTAVVVISSVALLVLFIQGFRTEILGAWCFWLIFGPTLLWIQTSSLRRRIKVDQLHEIHGKPEQQKVDQLAPEINHSAGTQKSGWSGMVCGLLGAWGWLLLLLLIGSFLHWVFIIYLIAGASLLGWLIRLGYQSSSVPMTPTELHRFRGRFIWLACLIQSAFCASILLLLSIPSLGHYLTSAFRIRLSTVGFEFSETSPFDSTLLLWIVCIYILLMGALLQWQSNAYVELAEHQMKKERSSKPGQRKLHSD